MSAGSGPRRREGSSRSSARSADPRTFAAGVGEAVRRARQARGWTQQELADHSGFSVNYVARLERGELGPSLFVASRLCETLDIALAALLEPAASARTTRRRVVG